MAFGIGEILRFLVSVVQAGIKGDLPELETGLYRCVDAAYLHVPEVDHRPLELIGSGHGDNLVFDLVVIGVHTRIETAEMRRRPLLGVSQTDVVLGRVFRFEVFVADKRVIEVIERGHAENPLVKCPEREVDVVERGVLRHGGRRKDMLAFGGRTRFPREIIDERVEQAALHVDLAETQRCGQCRERSEPRRIDEIHQVGFERVILEIGRQVDIPPTEQREFLCRRNICLLLVIMVVDIHRGHVQTGIGKVMQVVVGVFCRTERRYHGANALLNAPCRKKFVSHWRSSCLNLPGSSRTKAPG